MNIVEYLFALFAQAFVAVFGWFFSMLDASSASGLYLSVFCIYCVVRFLIVPIVGNKDTKKAGDD